MTRLLFDMCIKMVNGEIENVLLFLPSLKTQKENLILDIIRQDIIHDSRQNRNKRVFVQINIRFNETIENAYFLLCYNAQLEKEMHNVPKITV